MMNLPPDIKRVIALKLSPKDIINLCLTNKDFHRAICDSSEFWREKLRIDYPLVYNHYMKFKNPKNTYIRKFTEVHLPHIL